MDSIPKDPAGSKLFVNFATHSLVEKDNGVGLAPTHGPLYSARFFFDLYRNELILTGFRFKGRKPIPFGDILGIQTCYGGRQATKEGSYEKYELNLVLKESGKISRIHLVGHPDRETIERHAERIAARVPIRRFDHMDESIRRWAEGKAA